MVSGKRHTRIIPQPRRNSLSWTKPLRTIGSRVAQQRTTHLLPHRSSISPRLPYTKPVKSLAAHFRYVLQESRPISSKPRHNSWCIDQAQLEQGQGGLHIWKDSIGA